jgi:hypothetical protein
MKPIIHSFELFWRDLQACCFTQLRLVVTTDELLQRASSIASILQQLSMLQLYGLVLDEQPISPSQLKPPPPSGSEKRLEITLFPSASPAAGMGYIKFAIPAAMPEFAQAINLSQPDMNHPYWQMLDREVFPFLSLPTGVPVHPATGAKRIKSVAIVELPLERRPQPGRPPVEAALIDTAKVLAQAQSAITRIQRTNQQPPDEQFARVEKYQNRLAHLHLLQELERKFFAEVAQAESIFEVTVRKTAKKDLNSLPILNLDSRPDVSINNYLPAPPVSGSIGEKVWADIPATDLFNPQHWAPIAELKKKLDIVSDRSFWRSLQILRSVGLRTLPAKHDARIQLFYQPDLPFLLARWREHKPSRGCVKTAVITEPVRTTQIPTEPGSQPIDQDKIWTAITALLAEQEKLREQQASMTQTLARIETALTALAASVQQSKPFISTSNFRQTSSMPISEQHKAEVTMRLECSPPLLEVIARCLSSSAESIQSILSSYGTTDKP